MSNDRDDGRYNRPYSGGDWNAFRQGQADRDRWNQVSSNQSTQKSISGLNLSTTIHNANQGGGGAGGSIGELRVWGTLLLCLFLTPLPLVIAAVATPILVALRRRKGADTRFGQVFWPAVFAAFAIFAVNAILALIMGRQGGTITILGIEAIALLAAAGVLYRLGTHGSYKQAVIDAASAFLAPVALCLGVIALVVFG